MSHPGVPIVRVGYMAPALPYPVNVYLPPVGQPDARSSARTTGPYLDIVVPQDPLRHEKLGRFLNAWSALESTLAILLTNLSPLNLREANLIFPKLGTKNAVDLLDGLSRRKLTQECAKAVTGLLERVARLNTKRNILIHGQWY